ncbi:MAG: alpha-glucosidase [Bifidobacteriaceae bacterium]|nr:alpha-glucosidase [Bifidobacteriaceae bacterium]
MPKSRSTPLTDSSDWWKNALIYQIYPRSFQDSNGDGIGDIAGIISRLDYLADLGVDALWLSPIYPSPDHDFGYDIANYTDVDPKFGTLAEFDQLVSAAAERNIKIIMDLVINHTSDQHEWFLKSKVGDPEFKDFYIWQDQPNNWTSFFMGSAWTYAPERKQYYLHLFDPHQPDLNYHNPKVIQAVQQVMHFWLDRQVAGFRCDVINVLYKTSLADGKKQIALTGIEHYQSQPGLHPILQEFRSKVWEPASAFIVGETVMVDLKQAKELSDSQRHELDTIFYFDHLEVDRRVSRYVPKAFSASKLLETITKWQTGLDYPSLYLENHDQPRIVSHYGYDGPDAKLRQRSAKMLAVFELTQRGIPYVFQGQEIGMTNYPWDNLEQIQDVESHNIFQLATKKLHIPKSLAWKWIKIASRDNARTPMQWGSAAGAANTGFTTGMPWLPINPNHTEINVADQLNDPDSVWNFYKQLIQLRKTSPTLQNGEFKPVYSNRQLMIYERILNDERWTVLLNFSKHSVVPPQAHLRGEIVITNCNRKVLLEPMELKPYEALVLKV